MVTRRTVERRISRAPNRRRARQMRHVPAEAEQKFWSRVRDRRLKGHKFERPYMIGIYIVDFVCLERRLIVELDGGQHDIQQDYDRKRDASSTCKGFA